MKRRKVIVEEEEEVVDENMANDEQENPKRNGIGGKMQNEDLLIESVKAVVEKFVKVRKSKKKLKKNGKKKGVTPERYLLAL